jgi:hypothetical protein
VGIGFSFANYRPDFLAKPANSVNVWIIIQGTSEDTTGFRFIPWLEMFQIDTVCDYLYSARTGKLPKDFGLGFAYYRDCSAPTKQFHF